MITVPELVYGSLISSFFLLLFIISELWHKLGSPKIETTRKFVHFSSGAICLSFSYLFHSHLIVFLLCAVFVTIMVATKKLGLLKSIHSVKRVSFGSLYYPLAVYFSFTAASFLGQPHFYLIAILVLAISDSLAALVGGTYGFKTYVVEEHKKSLEGSIFFFLATFLIVHLCLLLLTPVDRTVSVLTAVYIAMLITAFESISLDGIDNLIIPLSTIALLQRVSTSEPEQIIYRIAILCVLSVMVFLLGRSLKKLGLTALIAVALVWYAALMLCGISWLLPLLTGFFLFATLDIFLERGSVQTDDIIYRIRFAFYLLVVSLFWIYLSTFTGSGFLMFTGFIVNITANLGILWRRRSLILSVPFKSPLPSWIRNANMVLRALLLAVCLALPSLLLNKNLHPVFTVCSIIAGTTIIECVYWITEKKFRGKWKDLKFLKFTAAVSMIVTSGLFLAAMMFYDHKLSDIFQLSGLGVK